MANGWDFRCGSEGEAKNIEKRRQRKDSFGCAAEVNALGGYEEGSVVVVFIDFPP